MVKRHYGDLSNADLARVATAMRKVMRYEVAILQARLDDDIFEKFTNAVCYALCAAQRDDRSHRPVAEVHRLDDYRGPRQGELFRGGHLCPHGYACDDCSRCAPDD